MKQVGVIGQGYVGLALATAAASAGHKVVGYDINSNLVGVLKQGKSHIEDVKSETLERLIKSNQYLPTDDSSKLINCDIIVIAVPTPLTIDRQPDLKFVEAAIETIASVIKSEILIINESTSYPGTLRKVIAEKIYSITGVKHRYAAAPERIDPGNSSWDISNTPRIISGLDDTTTKEAEEFYLTFTKSVITLSTPEVAEMSKLVENSFRQVNIAFVNELAQIANVFGVSINEVLSAADTKPYGYMRFTPGAGVGGHCIPVDPTYLSFEAKRLGVNSTFIERANEVNQEMPGYIVSRILKDNNNNLVNKKIIVIGVAYKANVSDTRETPALEIIKLLIKENAQVVWHDPLVNKFNDQESHEIKDQDIAVVLTLHKSIDIERIKKIKYVFDCTNKLNWAKNL
jgi:UDP-N-acetyl-D-glucosamine dehydrogenase